ncbi:Uncharacterized membrane protein At3g27390 [Linum perenne]
MDVPVGFLSTLWTFFTFLPFFFLLFILGLLKAVVIAPISLVIILFGNSAVILGLWIAHFLWTYYCVARTKRLGLVLKIVVMLLLPVPLVLWPPVGIVGSLLGGIGYGFFAPLLATFEAVGENVKDKFYHCFADGCVSTIKCSCTVVRDFTDFCFHSYFSFMDELSEKVLPDEKPMDVKLMRLPSCFLATLIGVPVDMLLITALALWKSPYMLLQGWKRLLEDLIGREGPFLETEDSLQSGLAYIVAVVSLFDEYVNDLLYLSEGSCLPRPKYRKNQVPKLGDKDGSFNRTRQNSLNGKLVPERTRSLKRTIQEFKAVQIWDWLFKSCEVNGRILLREELINTKDIEECLLKGNCKKLGIKLPAWTILQCLLTSAKQDSSGLVISDDVELTAANGPRDKVFDWFIEPLLIMKEQIRKLELKENEEMSLRRLVMVNKNERPEDWDEEGFPSGDHVRRAQLQALIRRLQGIVASMSRVPTFRRRFKNLVKVLSIEAIQVDASSKRMGGVLSSNSKGISSSRSPVAGKDEMTKDGNDNETDQTKDGVEMFR